MHDIKYPATHEWHVAINQYAGNNMSEDRPNFMYEAKDMASQIPYMALLFKQEREGKLPKKFKPYSHSVEEPIEGNHLKCCLGIKCAKCPHLKALEKAERSTETDIDFMKAWTCASHIVSNGGDVDKEGYILRLDQMILTKNLMRMNK